MYRCAPCMMLGIDELDVFVDAFCCKGMPRFLASARKAASALYPVSSTRDCTMSVHLRYAFNLHTSFDSWDHCRDSYCRVKSLTRTWIADAAAMLAVVFSLFAMSVARNMSDRKAAKSRRRRVGKCFGLSVIAAVASQRGCALLKVAASLWLDNHMSSWF